MGIDLNSGCRRAVFLDRDGVINESVIRDGRPYPPATVGETVVANLAEACLSRLKQCGFLLVVVTNQPDVRRGTARREDVEDIHKFLAAKLPLDDFFVCYHDDGDDCLCRKPRPGLLLEAAAKHNVDFAQSYFIGDRWRDIDAGSAVGCRTVLIDHRYNEREPRAKPDLCVQSLPQAVDCILKEVESH